jgi:hypothetical protein
MNRVQLITTRIFVLHGARLLYDSTCAETSFLHLAEWTSPCSSAAVTVHSAIGCQGVPKCAKVSGLCTSAGEALFRFRVVD